MTTNLRPAPAEDVPGRTGSRPGRGLWVLSAAYLLTAVLMFAVLLPATTTACGSAPLDSRFVWDAHDATAFAAACGHRGLAVYSRLQVFDLVYPALLATTVSAWATWLGARLGARRWLTVGTVAAAVTNAVLDYLENTAAWVLIRTETATSWIFAAGGGISLLKNLTGAVAITAVLGLAGWYLVTRWTARRDRP
ncbi:MAG: hypothetical protein FWH11_08690 [Micrococcales bacterium]|nr:hypothetical protein [Micrococcales bacterium]